MIFFLNLPVAEYTLKDANLASYTTLVFCLDIKISIDFLFSSVSSFTFLSASSFLLTAAASLAHGVRTL
jgi:hypothetical protein